MLKGRAFKFGDGISTDHITPGRLAHLRSNLPELTKHVMEDADPSFAARVRQGDFIVAGNNFGLGSNTGRSICHEEHEDANIINYFFVFFVLFVVKIKHQYFYRRPKLEPTPI